MEGFEEALGELAARVSRLEALLPGQPSPEPGRPEPSGVPDGGVASTFWLLETLDRLGLDHAVAYGGRTTDAEGAPVRWQITCGTADLLDTDWATVVPALAALGHPSRMQILQLVARGEARTAVELAKAEGLGTTGQIYHHLSRLVAGGWLEVTTRGQHQVPAERLVPLLVVLTAARP